MTGRRLTSVFVRCAARPAWWSTASATLLSRPENTVPSIAKLLGVSRATIYRYVRTPIGHPAAEQPTVRAELEPGI
ncbi:helix-turn-helix domain-containing protein [Nonomuraea fuscirosea]|uniref:helix-turn-helix domain-containing protein n=1 Tax=Nonomuraea fuscirosea TaxID=1291556 RepID=UPI0033C9F211